MSERIEQIDQPLKLRKEFATTGEAEKWCEEHGLSVGRMQGPSPRGILKNLDDGTSFDIQKWRNLNTQERRQLDGIMLPTGPIGARGAVVLLAVDPHPLACEAAS